MLRRRRVETLNAQTQTQSLSASMATLKFFPEPKRLLMKTIAELKLLESDLLTDEELLDELVRQKLLFQINCKNLIFFSQFTYSSWMMIRYSGLDWKGGLRKVLSAFLDVDLRWRISWQKSDANLPSVNSFPLSKSY